MLSGVGNNSTIQVVSRHLVNDTPFTTVHGTVVNGTLVSHISQKGRKCWPRTQRERPTGMRQPAASCSSGPAENGARVPRALPRTGRCSGCPSATMEAAQPCAPFHHRRSGYGLVRWWLPTGTSPQRRAWPAAVLSFFVQGPKS